MFSFIDQNNFRLRDVCLWLICWLALNTALASANDNKTFYVSKLGDNSNGLSWATAFSTIQSALDAVANNHGGFRIIIRPDTYFEAMLFPAQRGAKDNYNELVGDADGSFGSGTTGWVVIDAGDPEQRGYKSYDWWGPIRSNFQGWSAQHNDSTFSAIGWDRWLLRNLYVTGGDGGIFFDLTNQIKPFSVIIEDCIGIGRAFGGGVANCLSRHEEPITFRRCHLWALDWWGDTAGAYVRVENKQMPALPDVRFEDCIMVSPQCALKSSNFGFHTFTHISLKNCRLIALNFSQPQGTPTDGIIQSVQEGNLLKVDLEDCTLMGYKVFGVIVNKETAKEISYTIKGDVKAYVQFQQEVPAGFLRLAHWPAEMFQNLLPPSPAKPSLFIDKKLIQKDLCEMSAFIWQGKLCHLESIRPASGGSAADYYLLLKEAESGNELARCAAGHSLASLFVFENTVFIFASRWENAGWRDVTLFQSADLKKWESQIVIRGENEEIFNTSVCRDSANFILAYETNDRRYPAFTIKFATSPDLVNWTKLPEAHFGTNRYTACPCLRYNNGWYYLLYLEHRKPRWYFETYLARSKDLKFWLLSSGNPILRPEGLDEGINASDPDIIEFQGKTYLYYAVGDQRTWMNSKRVIYPGTMTTFFESWFQVPGIPDKEIIH